MMIRLPLRAGNVLVSAALSAALLAQPIAAQHSITAANLTDEHVRLAMTAMVLELFERN